MPTSGLLVDACVLIDYLDHLPIFTIADKNIGKIYVITNTIDEVNGLSEAMCLQSGFTIIEPTREQQSQAEDSDIKPPEDALCFQTAKDNNYVFVTNDKPLRKVCKKAHIELLWGCHIVVCLVKRKKMSKEEAKRVIKDIHSKNKRNKKEILTKLCSQIDGAV